MTFSFIFCHLTISSKMPAAYKIIAPRLTLRCYNPDDAQLLLDSITESLESLREWMPWTHEEPVSLDKRIEWLRARRAEFDSDGDYSYGIFNPEETRVIGGLGVHRRVGPGAFEIGYWMNSQFTQKGMMTEAVTATTKAVFETQNPDRIEIRCDPENIASNRVAEKCGYQNEGTWKRRLIGLNDARHDANIWTMYKTDYEKSTLKNFEVTVFDAGSRQIEIHECD